jgi:transcriptional regulator with XRE-family HTH domain
MKSVSLTNSAGAHLKELRLRLGLTLRDVEANSRKPAAEKQNQDFFISRGWLNNVENGSYTPSIYKLYSLGVIYRTHWSSIFSFFGLHVRDLGRDQALFGVPRTQLVRDSAENENESVVVPLRSRQDVRLDKTSLLSRLVEIWGEIPVRLIQHLDLRKSVYGLIGLSDFTMYPLIRPGSIVQIDGNQRKVLPAKWRTSMTGRPISSSCGTNTFAVGVRFGKVIYWRCLIPTRDVRSAGIPIHGRPRLSAGLQAWPCASPSHRPKRERWQ